MTHSWANLSSNLRVTRKHIKRTKVELQKSAGSISQSQMRCKRQIKSKKDKSKAKKNREKVQFSKNRVRERTQNVPSTYQGRNKSVLGTIVERSQGVSWARISGKKGKMDSR